MHRVRKDLRGDQNPDQQKQHEQAKQSLTRFQTDKPDAAPQEKDRRNGQAALSKQEKGAARGGFWFLHP